jgi:hypothetical protein
LVSIQTQWTADFENGFDDYEAMGACGFCYGTAGASSYKIVNTPVHRGQSAAAFSLTKSSSGRVQTRCVFQGALPVEARYGAWFFLPSIARNTNTWNLVHFQGGVPDAWNNLWDVSIEAGNNDALSLYLFDGMRTLKHMPTTAMSVPVGKWFHVEIRILRAKDSTGEVELFQDGVSLLKLTGLATDNYDFGQWYVGNYVEDLDLPELTVFVDDVSVQPLR